MFHTRVQHFLNLYETLETLDQRTWCIIVFYEYLSEHVDQILEEPYSTFLPTIIKRYDSFYSEIRDPELWRLFRQAGEFVEKQLKPKYAAIQQNLQHLKEVTPRIEKNMLT